MSHKDRAKDAGEADRPRASKRNRLTNILIILGIVLIVGAAGLAAYNEWDAGRAGDAAQTALSDLTIPVTDEADTSSDDGMTTEAVDDHDYLGVITVPSLDIELPVMSGWSYDNLQIAPCRYSGSYETDDLVICGHNYRTHFGPLTRVSIGADVYLTTVDGQRIHYVVSNLETVQPTSIDQMIDNENNGTNDTEQWDLTLFTCNLGGQTRHAVRCLRQTS